MRSPFPLSFDSRTFYYRMNIQKIVNRLKSLPLTRLKKYTEIDGVRYYKINNHIARIEFDEELGLFVGVFENMRAMTCFYVTTNRIFTPLD